MNTFWTKFKKLIISIVSCEDDAPNTAKNNNSVKTAAATKRTNIMEIEGIGEKYAQIFKDHGINTVEELLQNCITPKQRQALAAKTSLPAALLLKWANHADLFRINGIAGQYSELLEAAGVDTVKELAMRNPASLLEKLTQANASKKLTRKVPTLNQVSDWINEAKNLPRTLEY